VDLGVKRLPVPTETLHAPAAQHLQEAATAERNALYPRVRDEVIGQVFERAVEVVKERQ
jgi:hypothetical protein